jgi:hypothetical protein
MIKKLSLALIFGLVSQGLIFVGGGLRLGVAEYLMFPGAYALSPIFPEGAHTGYGVALFPFYLIAANVLCYAIVAYFVILLVSRRLGRSNG